MTSGTFVTQREHPKLALVKPEFANGGMTLSAPGMEPLHVSRQRRRRADHDFAVRRKARAPVDNGRGRCVVQQISRRHVPARQMRSHARLRKGGVQYPERDAAPTSFVDNYGILVISQASHAALNQKLPQAVPMNRFRPNIVVIRRRRARRRLFHQCPLRRGRAALRQSVFPLQPDLDRSAERRRPGSKSCRRCRPIAMTTRPRA